MARRVSASQLKSYSSYYSSKKTTSSSSSKPTSSSPSSNTSVNTNYENRLAVLEQKLNQIKSCNCDTSKITLIEQEITNLQLQINNLSNNHSENTQLNSNIESIRLYPAAYLHTEQNGSFVLIDQSCILYDFLISESNYTDEEIYNALKYRDTYIKDSVYASYFTVNNKKVNVSKNILNEIELVDGTILPLPIIVDLPNLNNINDYPNGLLFSFIANKTSKTINNIKFEIENFNYKKLNIKITYPETIQITTNVPNEYISSKQGKVITITNAIGDSATFATFLTGNTVESDVYKLVAQGEIKIYEIIIDWYKTTIPEYI